MRVHVEGWHGFVSGLSPAISTVLKREAALDDAWVSDIGEAVTVEHNLGAALVNSRSRTQTVYLRRVIVTEEEARINPVNSIKGYLHRQGLSQVIIRRCIADDTDGG